jgi:hypothetical protein
LQKFPNKNQRKPEKEKEKEKEKKKRPWGRFQPAPKDGPWPISLSLPELLPFLSLSVTDT